MMGTILCPRQEPAFLDGDAESPGLVHAVPHPGRYPSVTIHGHPVREGEPLPTEGHAELSLPRGLIVENLGVEEVASKWSFPASDGVRQAILRVGDVALDFHVVLPGEGGFDDDEGFTHDPPSTPTTRFECTPRIPSTWRGRGPYGRGGAG